MDSIHGRDGQLRATVQNNVSPDWSSVILARQHPAAAAANQRTFTLLDFAVSLKIKSNPDSICKFHFILF